MGFNPYYLLPLVGLALFLPHWKQAWFLLLERTFSRIASGRFVSYFLIAALSLLLNGTLALIRVPIPHINDEFAYLLGADTFAHGRLTNPPHPFWEHFESIHIIQQPTYASKYPPAQSLVLAIGQCLGHPIIGVWLSTILACCAIYWMLLVCVPKRWALFGGLISAIHPIILTWSYSYWGGAIAVAGGALLLGGLRRLILNIHTRDAFCIGGGMLILANSRPFEGFILTVLSLVGLVMWAFHGTTLTIFIKRVALPLMLSALVIGIEIGTYNHAVTGNAMQMPYMVHETTYGAAPFFAFQSARPLPAFRHKELRDFALFYRTGQSPQNSAVGFARAALDKLHTLAQGFLWSGLLVVPLLSLLGALRRERWNQFALICCAALVAALLTATWVHPHYAAPAFAPFLLLVVQGFRQLRQWQWRGAPFGLWVSRALVVLCLVTVPIVMYRLASKNESPWSVRREAIRRDLETQPGNHLILVHYSDAHNPNREWVYNAADIDQSKIVWARAMSPDLDNQLVRYFKDRRIWSLQADENPPVLLPMPQ